MELGSYASLVAPLAVSITFVVIFSVICYFVVGFVKRRRCANLIKNLATDHALKIKRESYDTKASGSFKGLDVEVWNFDKVLSNPPVMWTRVRTFFPASLGLGLKIESKNVFSSLGTMMGSQDIETGDRDFDSAFVVKGMKAEAILLLLDLETRRVLLDYTETWGGYVVFEDRSVAFEWKGNLADRDALEGALEAQGVLAAHLARKLVELRADDHQAVVPEWSSRFWS